mmetsp:Transcript_16133/g.19369  ORF Transcript_16133/g.19369 Transcript_16133/m.19369 type:complete len:107 (-) Transcript_16133:530-850(-)
MRAEELKHKIITLVNAKKQLLRRDEVLQRVLQATDLGNKVATFLCSTDEDTILSEDESKWVNDSLASIKVVLETMCLHYYLPGMPEVDLRENFSALTAAWDSFVPI